MNQFMGKKDNKCFKVNPKKSWHTLKIDKIKEYLNTDCSLGLNSDEAISRLTSIGFNQIVSHSQKSLILLFLTQFKSSLILILIFAAGLAAFIGSIKDACVILTIVFINAFVSFYQEYRAERSLVALRKMLPLKANVRRDGRTLSIDAEKIVPGDILLVEAGDQIPADGRLIIASNFDVDESTLTGESQPVRKQVNFISEDNITLADRLNMVYMNTLVTRGRAEFIATATGIHTEIGKLSQQLAAIPEPQSPLQIQLDKLGKRLGSIALILIGILFFFQLLRGTALTDALIDAIALAVAAIPEGLPVVATVTLALGMHKIARHHAIIKRLASVETLGCTTVICSDKTGTLTLNQMTVCELFYLGQQITTTSDTCGDLRETSVLLNSISNQDIKSLLIPLVICNDSHVAKNQSIGDPTEIALLKFSKKMGLNPEIISTEYPRIAEINFESNNKFMATFHLIGEYVYLFVKGAPDVLLEHCCDSLEKDNKHLMDDKHKKEIEEHYSVMASRGLRGLLIASRRLSAKEFLRSKNLLRWINDLTFIGLIGLQDPPRPEAKRAIEQCKEAGIEIKMITGDHRNTAMAIAHELGLQGKTLSGTDLDKLNTEQLAKRINEIAVFARVTSDHKMKIVQALQRNGHVVAMTGDGINDAPALKIADIGVAMGFVGTAVAKEAASMILTDDNFATIVGAVKQGRVLYDNILKFIRFQLSTTIGAILTVFFAPFLDLPEPFNPIQILWVAMIMDGPPAVSLALDVGRLGIMNEAPRLRRDPVLPWTRFIHIFALGFIMMVGTLGVLYFSMNNGDRQNALTLAFSTFVLFQFFNVFNVRSEKSSVFTKGFFNNRMLWFSLSAVLILQILAVHWSPIQAIFSMTHLTLAQWMLATGIASSILLLEEARKWLSTTFLHRK